MCLLIQMWGKRKTRSNSFISLELLIRPVTKVFPKILHESKNLREDEHFVYLYIRETAAFHVAKETPDRSYFTWQSSFNSRSVFPGIKIVGRN